jgi:hypothetical protein
MLVAPRRCARTLRLLRSRADWRVSDAIVARFLFRSENQFYYTSGSIGREPARPSNGDAGFVYDIERGVVGVWRSPAALSERLGETERADVIDSTKWLESPATLFPCGPRAAGSP